MSAMIMVMMIVCVVSACIVSVLGSGGYYWWSTRCGRADEDIKDCTEIKTKSTNNGQTLEIKLQYKGVEIKAPKNKDIYLYIEGTMSPNNKFSFDVSKNQDFPNKTRMSGKKFIFGKKFSDKIKTNTTIEYHLSLEESVDIELKKVYYKFD